MTKEKFLEIIDDLKLMHEYEHDLFMLNCKYNNKWGTQADIQFPSLEDTVIKLLIEVFHCSNEDMYFFIYDLNFGKDWKPGMITSMEKGDIDHSSPEKFYDWLIEEYGGDKN